jgi:hypothetical protein
MYIIVKFSFRKESYIYCGDSAVLLQNGRWAKSCKMLKVTSLGLYTNFLEAHHEMINMEKLTTNTAAALWDKFTRPFGKTK